MRITVLCSKQAGQCIKQTSNIWPNNTWFQFLCTVFIFSTMTSEANDWDETSNPMAKAYRNPKFNRYDEGPGADLDDDLQPGAIAADPTVVKTFDIHIGDLLADLNEQGVRNLCNKYGNIVHVIRNANTNWSIVKYDSLRYVHFDVYSTN